MRNICAILKCPKQQLDEYNILSNEECRKLREIDVRLYAYNQQNTNDIRYTDVTYIAITRDRGDISDNMILEVNDKNFDILLIYRYAHGTQLFLKEAL